MDRSSSALCVPVGRGSICFPVECLSPGGSCCCRIQRRLCSSHGVRHASDTCIQLRIEAQSIISGASTPAGHLRGATGRALRMQRRVPAPWAVWPAGEVRLGWQRYKR